jgi:cell division cycle protein 37
MSIHLENISVPVKHFIRTASHVAVTSVNPMANTIFNYSKWDKIELSDDESDLHPNIDKDSWFRMKHRSRIEREEKEDGEILCYNKENSEDQSRLNIIKSRIKGLKSGKPDEDAEFEDMDALIGEADELEKHISLRNKRISEINERRSWNADNICQTKEEKTMVNTKGSTSLKADDFVPTGATEKAFPRNAAVLATAAETSSAPSGKVADIASTSTSSSVTIPTVSKAKPVVAGPVESSGALSKNVTGSEQRDHHAIISYNDFVLSHEVILEEYSDIRDMGATKDYLFKHCGILLHEHAQSYMLLSSLEDEMNGKRERMKRVCRQSQILTHIQELATSMKRDPRDVVLPFFKRISEPEHLTGFKSSVDDFVERIIKRSVEKRKEMDAEGEYEEGEGQVGPGGLNPYEVLKSLPKSLRDAFESQDIENLHKVLGDMEVGEAKRLMKLCVDSGLWVAKDNSIFGEENDDEEKGED